MRIFIISPFNDLWHFRRGGTPTIFELVKGLIEDGNSVHYICPFGDGRAIEMEGLFVHRLSESGRKADSRFKLLSWTSSKMAQLAFIPQAAKAALEVARENRPDIIYGFASAGAIAAFIAARRIGVPNITRIFGTSLYYYRHNPLQLLSRADEILAFILPCKYFILTNDGTQGDRAAKFLGISGDRLKFWRNGVDDLSTLDPRGLPDGRPTKNDKRGGMILAMSRLVAWKRVDRIINAMPRILENIPEAELVIVGDGEERESLQLLAKKLNVQDRVKFAGAVPHDKVADFMVDADVFISMYDISNVGNPLLEAMRAGKAIITLDKGGTRDVIKNNENGLLLSDGNPLAVSEAVIRLLCDEGLRRRLAGNAKKFAAVAFQTWEERIRMEVEMIRNINKNSCFQATRDNRAVK